MEGNVHSNKFIVLAICAWASHFISLWGTFAFDDSEAIIKNKDVLPGTPVKEAFLNDFWGTDIKSNASHKSYRPLTILSYRLNVFFSNGRLDAFQFHTANVVLHGLLSIMTLPFFECLLKRRRNRKTLAPLDDPAFTGALLFAVHPVHTEAVAALVGRADILTALIFVAVIIFYRVPSGICTWFLMVFWCTSLAVLCKETGITVLGFCICYELYLRNKVSKSFCTHVGLLGLIGAVIMYFRLKLMNFEGPIFSPTDNPAAFAECLLTRILSYSYVYVLNIVLLIWPQWLCFDWSMGCVPLVESFYDYRSVYVVSFWVMVALITCKTLSNIYNQSKLDLTTMGLSLLIIPFLPSSNLLFKVGFVIAERNLLLPSLGYCLLIGVGFQKLKNRFENLKLIFTGIYVLLIGTFIARSMYRNFEWITEERLFKSALNVCPQNAKVHYNIAKVAADQGQKSIALSNYRKAIDLHPNYEQAMNNLANLLRENGQLDEAETLLRKAVDVRPNFAAAWMNLGIVLSGKGRVEEAETAYKMAIKYRSKYADAQYNLGNLYLDVGRHEEALAAWKNAVHLRASHVAAWGNALALLDSKGRAQEAIKLGAAALRHAPKAPSIHFAVGNALGKLNRFPEAEFHFQQAIKLNESNALYYSNLGVLYHRWEKREKARQMYLKALTLDPNLKSAIANLRKLDNLTIESHGVISNEFYKVFEEGKSVQDQVTLILAENYLALKLGEEWKEIKQGFSRCKIKPIQTDEETLKTMVEITDKWAKDIQTQQHILLKKAATKQHQKELLLYNTLRGACIADAWNSMSEMKYIAHCTERLFRITSTFNMQSQIADSRQVPIEVMQMHKTFQSDVSVTCMRNLKFLAPDHIYPSLQELPNLVVSPVLSVLSTPRQEDSIEETFSSEINLSCPNNTVN